MGGQTINRNAQLTAFFVRLKPYRWPVRIGVFAALAISAGLSVWPSWKATSDVTLIESVRDLCTAFFELPFLDFYACCGIFLLTTTIIAFIGGFMGAIGVFGYQAVRERAISSALLPASDAASASMDSDLSLNYAPAPTRYRRRYKWLILLCIGTSVTIASFQKVWPSYYFGPGEILGMRNTLWEALAQLHETHHHFPLNRLLFLYIHLLVNTGVAILIGLFIGLFIAAAIRFRIKEMQNYESLKKK